MSDMEAGPVRPDALKQDVFSIKRHLFLLTTKVQLHHPTVILRHLSLDQHRLPTLPHNTPHFVTVNRLDRGLDQPSIASNLIPSPSRRYDMRSFLGPSVAS